MPHEVLTVNIKNKQHFIKSQSNFKALYTNTQVTPPQ